jgi:hypothetical protein
MDSATDVDNNGTIDYDEFIATTVHMSKLEREEHLLTAFTAARQAQTWSTLVSTTSSEVSSPFFSFHLNILHLLHWFVDDIYIISRSMQFSLCFFS